MILKYSWKQQNYSEITSIVLEQTIISQCYYQKQDDSRVPLHNIPTTSNSTTRKQNMLWLYNTKLIQHFKPEIHQSKRGMDISYKNQTVNQILHAQIVGNTRRILHTHIINTRLGIRKCRNRKNFINIPLMRTLVNFYKGCIT